MPKYTKFQKFERIGEYDIPLPDMPPLNQIEGYRLSEDNQYFKHTVIPENLKELSDREQYNFVKGEYDKRKNGLWIYIKGKPVYIPGTHYFFLNYWRDEKGRKPYFKMSNRDFFLFWEYCVSQKNCYGMVLVKARRIGATEMVLCALMERATRIRLSRHLMLDRTEEMSEKSFNRMMKAFDKIDWFMKPIHHTKGNGIYFEQSKRHKQSQNSNIIYDLFEEKIDNIEYIRSELSYDATTLNKGDGGFYKTIYLDEYAKITSMDVLDYLSRTKPAMHSDQYEYPEGKIILTSTIEDDGGGETLEMAKKLYDMSDPNNLVNGYTTSGFYRLFMDATGWLKPDKFGYVDKEEYIRKRNAKIKNFIKLGEITELIRYKRKEPMSIDDAFANSAQDSIVNAQAVSTRLFQVQSNLTHDNKTHYPDGTPVKKRGVKGNLIWAGGKRDTKVEFYPDPDGHWTVYEKPFEPNAFYMRNGYKIPTHANLYGFGIDPYEQVVIKGQKSNGAGVVFRKFDAVDDRNAIDKNGEVIPHLCKTNKIACEYNYRHENPYDFFDDMIKTAVYYSTDFLVEDTKASGLLREAESRRYHAYLQYVSSKFTNNKQRDKPGAPAQTGVIINYIELIQDYTHRFIDCIDSEELLRQLLTLNNTKESRTKRDLAVAFGFALMATHKERKAASNPHDESFSDWVTTYSL